jgi:hypothetical protein
MRGESDGTQEWFADWLERHIAAVCEMSDRISRMKGYIDISIS